MQADTTGPPTGTPTPVADRTDPVHRFAGVAAAALDPVASAPAWAMRPVEQAETLVELTALAARVEELRWRVPAAADRNEVGAADGATSTAAWLEGRTRENRARTNGDLRGARLLDQPLFETTRVAFAKGLLTVDQVWVVLRCVEDLPAEEVSDDQRVRAQEYLIALAAEHDAKTLRVLAWRIFEVLAPEEADRREAEALAAEERRARQACRFAMRENGDGTASGWFKLPELQAGMLSKAVQALAAPRRTAGPSWTPEGRSRGPRRDGRRATPCWSRPCSGRGRSRWTWAGRPGSSPARRGRRSRSGTGAAPHTGATGRRHGARPITTSPGRSEAQATRL